MERRVARAREIRHAQIRLRRGDTGTYLKLKHDEWNAYSRHLTGWERETALDC
jgi:glutamine synthetase